MKKGMYLPTTMRSLGEDRIDGDPRGLAPVNDKYSAPNYWNRIRVVDGVKQDCYEKVTTATKDVPSGKCIPFDKSKGAGKDGMPEARSAAFEEVSMVLRHQKGAEKDGRGRPAANAW